MLGPETQLGKSSITRRTRCSCCGCLLLVEAYTATGMLLRCSLCDVRDQALTLQCLRFEVSGGRVTHGRGLT
jgi:hypothetical protein